MAYVADDGASNSGASGEQTPEEAGWEVVSIDNSSGQEESPAQVSLPQTFVNSGKVCHFPSVSNQLFTIHLLAFPSFLALEALHLHSCFPVADKSFYFSFTSTEKDLVAYEYIQLFVWFSADLKSSVM